ncbi:MAG TPA: hypothetical protein VMU55_00500 [Solirubrobacteraceae bacterium]|nr:hypothetical protein [Solirubrobacteraceae bacterium]
MGQLDRNAPQETLEAIGAERLGITSEHGRAGNSQWQYVIDTCHC